MVPVAASSDQGWWQQGSYWTGSVVWPCLWLRLVVHSFFILVYFASLLGESIQHILSRFSFCLNQSVLMDRSLVFLHVNGGLSLTQLWKCWNTSCQLVNRHCPNLPWHHLKRMKLAVASCVMDRVCECLSEEARQAGSPRGRRESLIIEAWNEKQI